MVVVDALQKGVEFGNEWSGTQLTEIVVPIPFGVIGAGRDRKRLQDELEKLLSIQVKYSRPIPGSQLDVTSTIVSSVIRRDGQFFVTIPPTSLPFYLFCGHSVGFLQVERDILLRLPSANQKLLHLFLAEKIDAKSKSGILSLSPSEIINRLGLSMTYPTSSLLQNIILPYITNINRSASCYSLNLNKIMDPARRRGRPRTKTIQITANPRKDDEGKSEQFIVVHNFLDKHMKGLDHPTMSPIGICEQLEKDGLLGDFTWRMSKFQQKEKDAGTVNVRHTANTIRKVLREEYNIII